MYVCIWTCIRTLYMYMYMYMYITLMFPLCPYNPTIPVCPFSIPTGESYFERDPPFVAPPRAPMTSFCDCSGDERDDATCGEVADTRILSDGSRDITPVRADSFDCFSSYFLFQSRRIWRFFFIQ